MRIAAASVALLCVVAAPAFAAETPLSRHANQRMDLDFVRADVHNVLRLLADAGEVNLVVSGDVHASITVRLRNVRWADALDAVLNLAGLAVEQRGNVLRVAPLAQLQSEAESRARLAHLRELDRPLVTRIVPVDYARASELVPQVKALLSERGTVTADDRTNTLIIRDVAQ
jgi:type II secretory pathway component HofQ